MSGYILAIDQGTTSSRAIVFNDLQQIVGMGKMEFTQHFPASGWVEHVPEEIWATCLWSAKTALKKAGIAAADVAAIGITNQRETTIVWDRATGKPIHNAIVWQDRRTAAACEKLKRAGKEKLVSRKTGL
ncbi:MAG TPA: FGGY family carbohydrate kinase, partial [Devosia sp.]|nr:FGGY family carbohydrate kinase [Devosia sp.]